MSGVRRTAPISLRLDEDVRAILEAEAKAQGIGLAAYLRQLASTAARYVAENPEARAFYEDWGTASTGIP